MTPRMLVAYATKHGATREIAERIGDVLHGAGIEVDVKPMDLVGDLSGYDAVVGGTAVYMGQWRKDAKRFLIANQVALSERPVWWFVSGPTGAGDPMELVQGWVVPARLKPYVDRIAPRDIAVFHGKVDPEALGGFEGFVIRTVKAETGDFRDWEAIAGWARVIAEQVNATLAA